MCVGRIAEGYRDHTKMAATALRRSGEKGTAVQALSLALFSLASLTFVIAVAVRGTVLPVPVLFLVAAVSSFVSPLGFVEAGPTVGTTAGLACLLAVLGTFVLVLRVVDGEATGAGAVASARRANLLEDQAQGWNPGIRLKEAIGTFAFGPGQPSVQLVELYRFRRWDRRPLIVMVRRDTTGEVLGASTFDIEMDAH